MSLEKRLPCKCNSRSQKHGSVKRLINQKSGTLKENVELLLYFNPEFITFKAKFSVCCLCRLACVLTWTVKNWDYTQQQYVQLNKHQIRIHILIYTKQITYACFKQYKYNKVSLYQDFAISATLFKNGFGSSQISVQFKRLHVNTSIRNNETIELNQNYISVRWRLQMVN